MSRLFIAGSTEYIAAAVQPVGALPISIHFWVKATDDDPAAAQYPFFYGDSGNSSDWITGNFTTSGTFRGWARNEGAQVTSAGDIADGAFHAAGMTVIDAGATRDLELYIDGLSEGSAGASGATLIGNFDTVAIGMLRDSSPGGEFSGDMAELGIWNVELTAAEFAMLGLGYSPLFVRPGNLQLYLPMVRDNDNDLVGGANFSDVGGTPDISPHPKVVYPSSPFSGFGIPVGGATFNVDAALTMNLSASNSEVADFLGNAAVTVNMSASDSEVADFVESATLTIDLSPATTGQIGFNVTAAAGLTLAAATSEVLDAVVTALATINLSPNASELADFAKTAAAGLTLAAQASEVADLIASVSLTVNLTSAASGTKDQIVTLFTVKMGVRKQTFSLEERKTTFKIGIRPDIDSQEV